MMKLHLDLGPEISSAIQQAIALAERHPIVSFEFNDIEVNVRKNSDPALVLRDWKRALAGCIENNIGPNYAAKLTPEQQAHDLEVEADNDRRSAARQATYDEQKKSKRELVEAELVDKPPLALRDPDGWEKSWEANRDSPYGAAILSYAERWGRLMQVRMEQEGSGVTDVANRSSHDADVEGITGFMYGAAASILASTWEHGEDLRRWHNLKTQIGNEGEKANESGGVLNPAILSIGE
jgi:hypothetical protein